MRTRSKHRSAVALAGALALQLAAATPLGAVPLPRFFGTEVWYHDVSGAAVHPQSASMISTLAGLGGFGNGRMQIDFSFHVVHAAAGAPTRAVEDGGGYYSPDCEAPGTAMPVPAGAAIEGETGLSCDRGAADCHLLVVQGRTLYEAYNVSEISPGGNLEGLCLAIWNLDALYPPAGRGEHCTSADAAGFPIAPLLFNADEIAAALADDATGDSVDLGHAIRFILPNPRMANDPSLGGVLGRLYVRPASHAGAPSGPVGSVPYGSRLRLRADFPLAGYNPAARVLLNTFKRFGIVLSDGGTVALTGESDLYTTTKWVSLGIDAQTLYETDDVTEAIDPLISDFVVLDTGPRIAETYDCVRSTPVPALFADGFQSAGTTFWSGTVPSP